MTEQQQHPITPPPELVQQWLQEADINQLLYPQVAAKAAQWGADQELEACIEVIADHGWFANPEHRMAELRAARRPKPQSLKEQSIALIDLIQGNQKLWQLEDLDVVRRALESIPDPGACSCPTA